MKGLHKTCLKEFYIWIGNDLAIVDCGSRVVYIATWFTVFPGTHKTEGVGLLPNNYQI